MIMTYFSVSEGRRRWLIWHVGRRSFSSLIKSFLPSGRPHEASSMPVVWNPPPIVTSSVITMHIPIQGVLPVVLELQQSLASVPCPGEVEDDDDEDEDC